MDSWAARGLISLAITLLPVKTTLWRSGHMSGSPFFSLCQTDFKKPSVLFCTFLSPWVGPGKPNLPLGFRGKAGGCRRIDAFELWCWRRLLRVPWTTRRSNQSILKETSPGCSLEGLMLKLKLQYFGHLMRRIDSLEKTLMLGGIRGRRRRAKRRGGPKWSS